MTLKSNRARIDSLGSFSSRNSNERLTSSAGSIFPAAMRSQSAFFAVTRCDVSVSRSITRTRNSSGDTCSTSILAAIHSSGTGAFSSFRRFSNRVQGLLEIAQQVAPVLDANRDTHQAIGDAGLGELLFGKAGLRGRFRMAGKRFHAAE